MVKYIVFDLDDTLYDYNLAHSAAMLAVNQQACLLLNLDEEKWCEVYNQAKEKVKNRISLQAASHNRMLYLQNALEALQCKSKSLCLKLYDVYWNTFLENMQLKEHVAEALDYIKNQHMKMGICSDLTVHIQYRKLVKLNLESYFDAVVTSEEVGIEKPNEVMFYEILRKLDAKKEEVIYVGDSVKKDIEGASAVGIKAYLDHDFFQNYRKYIVKGSSYE